MITAAITKHFADKKEENGKELAMELITDAFDMTMRTIKDEKHENDWKHMIISFIKPN